MTIRRILYFFLFSHIFSVSQAQDTALMTQLLKRIEQLQVKEDGVFPKGSFASYRLYALNKDREKADPNPFFTGLIAMTLKNIYPHLSSSQQLIANRIVEQAAPSFQKFKNRKGRDTYNFWSTDTPRIFPHSGWLNLFDKSQSLPDDLDDTVIMLLAQGAPDSTAKKIHALMQGFTNNGHKQVRNTYKDYRSIGAYSTWFGRKMPVDFDVCVLSNILYFVQLYNLSWTAADSASLYLIKKVITEKKYITDAHYVSPHYQRTPNILYHLSRLMSVKPIASLDSCKESLVVAAKERLKSADNFMDAVLLSTALLRWGVVPETVKTYEVKNLSELIEEEKFAFFIANMTSMLPDPLKQWMGTTGIGKFYYDCDAYNNLLVLEYLVWKKLANERIAD